MGLKNEKQGVCFVRFSLLTCQNTKKLVKNVLNWQIFPQKQTKKVPEFARGGLKKGIHYSDFCPISGKFPAAFDRFRANSQMLVVIL